MVLYFVLAPIAVVGGTYYGVHHQPTSASGGDSVPQQQMVIPAPISTATMTAGPGPSVVVPRTARVGANGLVTLICQAGPGLAGYLISAQPGAIVVCTNGATPTVVG